MSKSYNKKSVPLSEILENFKSVCNREGLKITHQRLEIFRQLAASSNHPTVESIYRLLKKKIPTISLDTVYRTIRTFEKYNLVNRIETPESQARFEVAREKHHHLICSECGSIADFPWPSFDNAQLPPGTIGWGNIQSKNVVLKGQCSKCTSLDWSVLG